MLFKCRAVFATLPPSMLPQKRKNNQPVALVAVFLCWEGCFDAIHPVVLATLLP